MPGNARSLFEELVFGAHDCVAEAVLVPLTQVSDLKGDFLPVGDAVNQFVNGSCRPGSPDSLS